MKEPLAIISMIGGTSMMTWNIVIGLIFACPAAVYYTMKIYKEYIQK